MSHPISGNHGDQAGPDAQSKDSAASSAKPVNPNFLAAPSVPSYETRSSARHQRNEPEAGATEARLPEQQNDSAGEGVRGTENPGEALPLVPEAPKPGDYDDDFFGDDESEPEVYAQRPEHRPEPVVQKRVSEPMLDDLDDEEQYLERREDRQVLESEHYAGLDSAQGAPGDEPVTQVPSSLGFEAESGDPADLDSSNSVTESITGTDAELVRVDAAQLRADSHPIAPASDVTAPHAQGAAEAQLNAEPNEMVPADSTKAAFGLADERQRATGSHEGPDEMELDGPRSAHRATAPILPFHPLPEGEEALGSEHRGGAAGAHGGGAALVGADEHPTASPVGAPHAAHEGNHPGGVSVAGTAVPAAAGAATAAQSQGAADPSRSQSQVRQPGSPQQAGAQGVGTRNNGPAAARAIGLVKEYGQGDTRVTALKGVNVDFVRNEFTAIMGPSGSGKSTLMHCMAGLDSATHGQAIIGDTDLSRLRDRAMTNLRRDRLGFIFQSFNLVPTLTAAENITLPLDIAGKKVDQSWFEEITNRLGLMNRLTHRPAELSGGQQQRVACARALVSRPEIIFGDEPTGNLDSNSSAEVLSILRTAVNHDGQTVVIVTHDAKAASYADRVIFLADGSIVQELRDPDMDTILATMAGIERKS